MTPYKLWLWFWLLVAIIAVTLYLGIPKLKARKARKMIARIITSWIVREFIDETKCEFGLETLAERKKELAKKVSLFQERRKQARQLASAGETRLPKRELSKVIS